MIGFDIEGRFLALSVSVLLVIGLPCRVGSGLIVLGVFEWVGVGCSVRAGLAGNRRRGSMSTSSSCIVGADGEMSLRGALEE